jgi:hypothetical protein
MKSELHVLLSEEDTQLVEKNISTDGYYDINMIKNIISNNTTNFNDFTYIDVDTVITIDLYINYPIFITDSNIFTKDELVEKYLFNKFEAIPETIFSKQFIEVINKEYILYDSENNPNIDNTKNIYPTQVYIGKERWKDYYTMFRVNRSIMFINDTKKLIK